MSHRKRDLASDTEDPAGAPFTNDAERAESRWLLARESNPAAQAPSPSIAKEYEKLEEMLCSLPANPGDERWHDQVLSLAGSQTSTRPRWRSTIVKWTLAGGVAAAATVAAVLLLRRHSELDVAILHRNEVRDSSETVVGDRLVVTARPRAGFGDLRVFQADGSLVAKCPDGPGCAVSSDDHYVIDLVLEKPVRYRVILVVGDKAALGDLPESAMDTYLKAARTLNARVIRGRVIDVR